MYKVTKVMNNNGTHRVDGATVLVGLRCDIMSALLPDTCAEFVLYLDDDVYKRGHGLFPLITSPIVSIRGVINQTDLIIKTQETTYELTYFEEED